MIQFNLLPDVKLEYIKAEHQKHTVIVSAVIAGATALSIFVLLFLVVNVLQSKSIKDLTGDIKTNGAKLQSVPDLNKILTVQNQLQSLPALHNAKYVTTRLPQYLKQVTPANVSIAKLDIDFTANTISISGASNSLETINKFVDTLKFTEYTLGDQKSKAFSSVVLTTFGRDDKGASFQINLKYDPVIFDSSKDIQLTVPKIVTTRSETEKPSDLFQPLSNTNGGQ